MPEAMPWSMRWVLWVGPDFVFSPQNGAVIRDPLSLLHDESIVHYNIHEEFQCFRWQDATDDNPSDLAAKFVVRFPKICEAGYGEDAAYAEWYREFSNSVRSSGALPTLYSEVLDIRREDMEFIVLDESRPRDAIFRLPPQIIVQN